MSYKTGGLKSVWEPQTSSYEPTRKYTIYTACESVSDISGYVMHDEKGKEVNILSYWDEDTAKGRESLIDVLYYLKHKGVGVYDFGAKWRDIIIEEMTPEEIDKVFRNR